VVARTKPNADSADKAAPAKPDKRSADSADKVLKPKDNAVSAAVKPANPAAHKDNVAAKRANAEPAACRRSWSHWTPTKTAKSPPRKSPLPANPC